VKTSNHHSARHSASGRRLALRSVSGSHPRPASDLRIISGLYKGQRLRSPESALTHPMGAREKLALFNLLQPYLNHESKVLDLYAGSGALGIEALSRGASRVVFVEKSPRIAHLITENLAALNPAPENLPVPSPTPDQSLPARPSVQVFPEPVSTFCGRPEYLSYFDIILADPPYDNFHPEDFANISRILAEGGVFILSSPAKINPPEIPGLQQETTRTYAAARLTVYHR